MTDATKQQPPKLGDVEFEPARGRWNVRRAGELVVEGVTLQQMLGVIRGERTVESLAPAGVPDTAGNGGKS